MTKAPLSDTFLPICRISLHFVHTGVYSIQTFAFFLYRNTKLGVVEHTCNSSYVGGHR
jgi:hypothetical protein